MRLLLLGPPGAGKGTQARLLASRLKSPHIASGDLLRDAMEQATPLGREAKAYVERGDLVPDEIVLGVIAERLKAPDAEGFVLDGFPRTGGQARDLDRALEDLGRTLDAVLHLEVPDEEIVERLTGRLFCPQCQRVYHVLHDPPREEGTCDDCGGPLSARKDDDAETVRHRLRVQYHEPIGSLLKYYDKRGLVVPVDGMGSVKEVSERIAKAIEAGT